MNLALTAISPETERVIWIAALIFVVVNILLIVPLNLLGAKIAHGCNMKRKRPDMWSRECSSKEAYHLEISSPGIERELKNDMHIEACEGWAVELRLYAPIDGAKVYHGVLLGLTDEGDVALECDGTARTFARSAIAMLKTHYEFD